MSNLVEELLSDSHYKPKTSEFSVEFVGIPLVEFRYIHIYKQIYSNRYHSNLHPEGKGAVYG